MIWYPQSRQIKIIKGLFLKLSSLLWRYFFLWAKKQDIVKKLKLEIVKRYLNGESPTSLANEYGLSTSGKVRTWKWSNKYRTLGEQAFEESKTNKSYSKELKLLIVEEYLSGKDSLEGLANKYNISSDEIVRQWVIKYNNGTEITDYNPKGDVYAMKSRKTSLEENRNS